MKTTGKMFLIIIILSLLIITGCVTTEQVQTQNQKHVQIIWSENLKDSVIDSNTITKLSIPEDNVTCYMSTGAYKGGISCHWEK